MWLYGFLIWLAFGLAFWIDYQRTQGWPRRWRTRHNHDREEGWRDAVLVSIPLSVVGGPLWWLAFIIVRMMWR